MEYVAAGGGGPALTDEMVAHTAGLYAWAESVELAPADLADLTSRLIQGWQQGQPQCMQAVLQADAIFVEVESRLQADPSQEDQLRRQCREWIVERSMDLASVLADWFLTSPGSSDAAPTTDVSDHQFAESVMEQSDLLYRRRMRDLRRDW